MRVIAGSARGRAIVAPKGTAVRPTGDKVRQATFNALDSRGFVSGATVVDLFAGTGALGIEALSRGAGRATFVDAERLSVDCIRQNVEHLGFGARSTVVRSDVQRWLDGLASPAAFAVDEGSPLLVLADPPYEFAGWPALLERLLPHLEAVRDDSMLVAESPRTLPEVAGWEVDREQRYGIAVVTLLRPAAGSEAQDDADGGQDGSAGD
jgi:16S rRNA (guanine966-N2)-methyltransferase